MAMSGELHTEKVTVRLTLVQIATLQAAAREKDIPTATYIRNAAMQKAKKEHDYIHKQFIGDEKLEVRK